MSYFTGFTGPPGAIGILGNTGLTGTAGIYGEQGSTGYTGILGPYGEQGMDGPQGEPGTTGPVGPTGQRGPIGMQGIDGPEGPIGMTGFAFASTANWTTPNDKNTYSTGGNIGIGVSNPVYLLDVNGTVNISKISYVTNMCEYINTLTASATNVYNINYATGSLFFLSTAPTANMTVKIYNLPSITDTTRSYIVNFIYKGTGQNYYVNAVNVTSASTPSAGATTTPKFLQTVYVSSITSSNLIFQTVVYFYLGTTSYIVSSVNGYAS